ncbi:MAG: SNF2 helicase-associated domain-containing protein, partial [Steroidobacteraceae bacterium]
MISTSLELYVTSRRELRVEAVEAQGTAALPAAAVTRIERAFCEGEGAGLIHLATAEVKTALPPGLAFARHFAQRYVTRLCHLGDAEPAPAEALVERPDEGELGALALEAPPVKGLEYLDAGTLGAAWEAIDAHVRSAAGSSAQSPRAWLHDRNPLWRLVGRVTLHLAENKRDEDYPFAFLATYAATVSAHGEAQHLALGRALQELAGAANRKRLAGLLMPIRDASERVSWVRDLLESGDIYHPLAWTPAEAHRLLRDVPALEASGLVVRIPDWWKAGRAPRPQVRVSLGEKPAATLGTGALLDFSVGLAFDGQPLTDAEREELLASSGGLMRLRGQWIEADGDKLAAALVHWKKVEREARAGGLSFYEGMRLLAGAGDSGATLEAPSDPLREWSGIGAGEWLSELLTRLNRPEAESDLAAAGLEATLRPYQVTGAKWLALLAGLGLGACLADDMGLGKTIQVIALLLHLRSQESDGNRGAEPARRRSRGARGAAPALIVAPASLVANWKGEIERFAPSLTVFVAHPSESTVDLGSARELESALTGVEVALTTYGVVARSAALRERRWRLVVLDEAQAIKNPGAQQTRAVKGL